MRNAVVGVDISKEQVDVVVVWADGKHKHRVFANTKSGFSALVKWLKEFGVERVRVCMEATGRYGEALAHFLHEAAYEVSVVNPARIKKYAASQLRRTKTDKADAALIADFARSQPMRCWVPPDAAWLELQTLVRHLSSLQAMRQQEANRLTAELPSPLVKRMLRQHLDYLQAQIDQLKLDIETFVSAHPTLGPQHRLLMTIPGIAHLTAARILAEVPDVAAFESPGQLAAYAGLTPGQVESGSSIRQPAHLVKTGNTHLRSALYFPAIVAKQHNPIIRQFCRRLEARGLAPKAIIAAAMHKLLHLAYGVLKHQLPFDPDFLAKSPAPS